MRQCVIFDFDGVIINSRTLQENALLRSYQEVVGDSRYPDVKEFFLKSGEPLAVIFNEMGLPEEMVEKYRQISKMHGDMIQINEKVIEIIAKLRHEGILCALCTGKDRERTEEILEKRNMKVLFDSVLCSDDLERGKPYPDCVNKILNDFQLEREDTIFVGDGVNDILCAHAAGIESIAVTWGDVTTSDLRMQKPSYLIDTPEELDAVLRQKFKRKYKKKLLFYDLVIREDLCNLHCDYCLTNTSKLHKENIRTLENVYLEDNELGKTLHELNDSMHSNFDISILKISGGELFAIKNIMNYIKKIANEYDAIQIISNGTLLNLDLIKQLKEIPKLCMQLSVDCHLLEGNRYRSKSEKTLNKVLENIQLLIQYQIPIEINCVLTDRNIPYIEEFVKYLVGLDAKQLVVVPFPVRGRERNQYFPKSNMLDGLKNVIENYDKYQSVLPPKLYLDNLYQFIEKGTRKGQCYIPQIAVGGFDNGTLTPCPNYWFDCAGNLLDKESFDIEEYYKTSKLYSILKRKNIALDVCKTCFTPWELLNNYLNGEITIDELSKLSIYNMKKVKARLITMKEEMSRKEKEHEYRPNDCVGR